MKEERMRKNQRVKILKRYSFHDELIDKCLIFEVEKRISWK
jgi:hypothetical protein